MAHLYFQSANPKNPVFFAMMTFNRDTSAIFEIVNYFNKISSGSRQHQI